MGLIHSENWRTRVSDRRRDRSGEDDAAFFEAVYRETYRSTLAYALRRTTIEADAHDVVAETYTVAWRRVHELRKARLPQAWIYGIAYNVLSNQRRARTRREALTGKVRQQSGVVEWPVDPAWSVEKRQQITEVCTALADLPQRDQEVLRLAAFEELDPYEIAMVLSVPAPLVRSILYRARNRLTKALESAARQGGVTGHKNDDGEPSDGSRRRYRNG